MDTSQRISILSLIIESDIDLECPQKITEFKILNSFNKLMY